MTHTPVLSVLGRFVEMSTAGGSETRQWINFSSFRTCRGHVSTCLSCRLILWALGPYIFYFKSPSLTLIQWRWGGGISVTKTILHWMGWSFLVCSQLLILAAIFSTQEMFLLAFVGPSPSEPLLHHPHQRVLRMVQRRCWSVLEGSLELDRIHFGGGGGVGGGHSRQYLKDDDDLQVFWVVVVFSPPPAMCYQGFGS